MKTDRPLIVFDIGNVLLRFDVARAERNFDRAQPGIGEALVEALWESGLSTRLEKGRITGFGFYRALKKKLGLKISFARFCRAFNDIFTPIRENMALLKKLSRRYPTALLSNTNALHWKYIFKAYPVLKSVEYPYSSHILKCMKPDPRIYRALARRTGFSLRRMVYIDDRPDLIEAARKLGVTSVLFSGERPLKRDLAKLGLI